MAPVAHEGKCSIDASIDPYITAHLKLNWNETFMRHMGHEFHSEPLAGETGICCRLAEGAPKGQKG